MCLHNWTNFSTKVSFPVFVYRKWSHIGYSRQGSGLQICESTAEPNSEQFLPPCFGGGLVQVLRRLCCPPPQVALHSDQSDQLV